MRAEVRFLYAPAILTHGYGAVRNQHDPNERNAAAVITDASGARLIQALVCYFGGAHVPVVQMVSFRPLHLQSVGHGHSVTWPSP